MLTKLLSAREIVCNKGLDNVPIGTLIRDAKQLAVDQNCRVVFPFMKMKIVVDPSSNEGKLTNKCLKVVKGKTIGP